MNPIDDLDYFIYQIHCPKINGNSTKANGGIELVIDPAANRVLALRMNGMSNERRWIKSACFVGNGYQLDMIGIRMQKRCTKLQFATSFSLCSGFNLTDGPPFASTSKIDLYLGKNRKS